jgi:hypothetical protein
MTTPWTQRQMMEVASRALGRVLTEDLRGITKLSVDDIAAMAGALIGLGLIATPPGEEPPANLMFTPKKEADDGI